MSTDVENKVGRIHHKVVIYLVTGEKMYGHLFRAEFDRLQDLMNDDRKFLPFYGLIDHKNRSSPDLHRLTLLNKSSIVRIEE